MEGCFDWNNLITQIGNVAGTALKKPDNYTYVTNESSDGNKLLIAGVVAILVVIGFKFLKNK